MINLTKEAKRIKDRRESRRQREIIRDFELAWEADKAEVLAAAQAYQEDMQLIRQATSMIHHEIALFSNLCKAGLHGV